MNNLINYLRLKSNLKPRFNLQNNLPKEELKEVILDIKVLENPQRKIRRDWKYKEEKVVNIKESQ